MRFALPGASSRAVKAARQADSLRNSDFSRENAPEAPDQDRELRGSVVKPSSMRDDASASVSGSRGAGATRSGSSQSIGSGCTRQRDLEHLLDRRHRHDLQARLHIVGNFGEILLILLGDDHGGDPGPQGREQLLLQSADGQRASAQGDLAGHRHIAAHRECR